MANPQADILFVASRIVADAGDSKVLREVDWSQNPANDRERELRAAMLRVLEKKTRWNLIAGINFGNATRWRWALEALTDADVVGSDLYDEIERAIAAGDEEDVERKKRQQDELIKAAEVEVKRMNYRDRFDQLFEELAKKHPRMGITKGLLKFGSRWLPKGLKQRHRPMDRASTSQTP